MKLCQLSYTVILLYNPRYIKKSRQFLILVYRVAAPNRELDKFIANLTENQKKILNFG